MLFCFNKRAYFLLESTKNILTKIKKHVIIIIENKGGHWIMGLAHKMFKVKKSAPEELFPMYNDYGFPIDF